jgi:RNA-dependent RNA polymerase
VKVKIHRLPPDIKTLDLYRMFSPLGNLSRIDILNDWKSNATFAFIVFWYVANHLVLAEDLTMGSPPPAQAVWEQRLQLNTSMRNPLQMELQRPAHSFLRESPVRKGVRYPERTQLEAKTLDFGVMYSEFTMMPMKSLDASRGSITFMLNLFRRQIEIQFLLEVAERSSERRVAVDQYSFQIPLVSVEKIFETVSDEDRSFIIPLDAPPEFYKKSRNIEATHEAKAHHWNQAKTWLRQTDITIDGSSLENAPISLRKENAAVNIGTWFPVRPLKLQSRLVGPS